MCSTFKASLAACVLASVDRGQARLDELIAYGPDDLMENAPVARQNLGKGAMSVAEMCEAAVELSDNTCANALLARVGGPSALTAFWRSIGDAVSRLDHNEPELNSWAFLAPSSTRNALLNVAACKGWLGPSLPAFRSKGCRRRVWASMRPGRSVVPAGQVMVLASDPHRSDGNP